MKKNLTLLFIVFFYCMSLSAYNFDVSVKNKLYELQEFSFIHDGEDFKKSLSNFSQNLNEKKFGEQELYTLKSSILIARLNNVSEKQELKELVSELKLLHEQMDDFYLQSKDLSEYFLTALGDIKSRLVNYVSGGDMYKISMDAKKLYQQAIRLNNKYAPAYTGYANWFYFAPAVAGGGYKEALKQFMKAVSNSSEKIDLYINLIYRSQTYLKLGNKKDCEKDLKSAHDIYPNEKLTEEIRGLNEKGLYFLN